jgi:hypothetical protein
MAPSDCEYLETLFKELEFLEHKTFIYTVGYPSKDGEVDYQSITNRLGDLRNKFARLHGNNAISSDNDQT